MQRAKRLLAWKVSGEDWFAPMLVGVVGVAAVGVGVVGVEQDDVEWLDLDENDNIGVIFLGLELFFGVEGSCLGLRLKKLPMLCMDSPVAFFGLGLVGELGGESDSTGGDCFVTASKQFSNPRRWLWFREFGIPTIE
jgi:hypothetical protein